MTHFRRRLNNYKNSLIDAINSWEFRKANK